MDSEQELSKTVPHSPNIKSERQVEAVKEDNPNSSCSTPTYRTRSGGEFSEAPITKLEKEEEEIR